MLPDAVCTAPLHCNAAQVGSHLGEALMELYAQLGETTGPDPARIRFDVMEGRRGWLKWWQWQVRSPSEAAGCMEGPREATNRSSVAAPVGCKRCPAAG